MIKRALTIVCVALLAQGNVPVWADDTPPSPSTGQTAPPAAPLSEDQIKSLVAPIALYPDELLSQVLVASTYPLEIVQANQWLQQHPDLKGQDLTQAAKQQNWDPSIQALVVFPDVMKRLSQDITWTTNLGNAFLANQASVMDTVQKLRINAEQAGKLASTEQAKVTNTTEEGRPVVEIEPANPDVIYVPEYDPLWIWGPAPLYYPYPFWYYRPRPEVGWCWWGGGLFIGAAFVGWGGWGGWGWHPGWYHHTVIVNNDFFVRNHFNVSHLGSVRGNSVWAHNSYHRLGVAYPNRALSAQFHPMARPAAGHINAAQVQAQFRESAARVRAAPMERIGNRQIAAGGTSRNRSAFGGVTAGGTARAYSNRGYSSLGHTRSGSFGGGGAHGGGYSGGHSGWGGGSGMGGGHR